MPLYVYELDKGTCADCPGTFELWEGINDPPSKVCPACEKPVHRIIAGTTFGIVRSSGDPVERAQKAGMKAYKKGDDGTYRDMKSGERMGGDGHHH